MGTQARTSYTTSINQLNIALMLISCVVAMFVPFQLFLFSYAFLGPAHYLTEISWLHKRRFFTKGRHDWWLMGALAAIAGAISLAVRSGYKGLPDPTKFSTTIIFFAFGSALILVLVEKARDRALGLAVVITLSLLTVNVKFFVAVMFALFVPTLIHVYVFTGFFIIYGALKERSRSGYWSFCIFLLCPLVFLFVQPQTTVPSQHVLETYWNYFGLVNRTLLGIATPRSQAEMDQAVRTVFGSSAGLMIMRFIAFAYTYHYLNWFSKTSLIKWHQMPRKGLALLSVLWLACIGLYLYNYGLGYKALACLSVMHVFLEFPLNHVSIIGTFRELTAPRGLEPGSAGNAGFAVTARDRSALKPKAART